MYSSGKSKEGRFLEEARIIAWCLQEAYKLVEEGTGEDPLD